MLDTQKLLQDKIAFYNQPQLVENPCHPAGFQGTWAFSDHSLIPDVLHGFLQRYFGVMRLRRIPLEKINELMNEVWEGPGSLEKVFRMEQDLKDSGKTVKISPADMGSNKKTAKEDDEDVEQIPDLPLSAFGNELFGDDDED